MTAGRLIARLTIGGLFVGHGTQKLFGWFGGPGPEGTAGMMEKLDMHPARRNAMAAGAAETAGGALLALGALTPAAAALLSGTMFTAIRKVHFAKGLWNTGGGYEYNATLIAALAALAVEAGEQQAEHAKPEQPQPERDPAEPEGADGRLEPAGIA